MAEGAAGSGEGGAGSAEGGANDRVPSRSPGRRDSSLSAPRSTLPARRSTLTARIKPLVFVLALLPFALLAAQLYLVYTGQSDDLLGANPVKRLEHATGQWALRFVALTLAVTPLRKVTGWGWLVKYRRMLGLFAFFYACVHVLTYFGLDQLFSLAYIGEDIAERPYITVGFTAWVFLIPLAVTSTKGWIRRLGKRWQLLHRLIYPATALGVLHFFWLVKADTREPLVFAAVFGLLMAVRLVLRRRTRSSGASVRPLRELRGEG